MPNTDQFWMADTPFPDLEIFVGFSEFRDTGGVGANPTSAALGNTYMGIGAGTTTNLLANITAALRRTGLYGSPALFQTQFGTAASQPGPSLVAGTSDPEGIRGFPPYTKANMPTLVGPKSGAIPKGIQINNLQIIYSVVTNPLTLATVALYSTQFVAGQNPAVTTLLAATNMDTTVSANKVVNVPVPTPTMIVAGTDSISLNVRITTPAGGTCNFWGVNCQCSYNLN